MADILDIIVMVEDESEYDKIQRMLDQQNNAGYADGQSESEALIEHVKWFTLHFSVGLSVILLWGTINYFAGLPHSNNPEIPLFTKILQSSLGAGILFMVLGVVWMGISYATGTANFMAEISRRAWTGGEQNEDTYKDYLKTINWGGWIMDIFGQPFL